jgi:Ca2+-binding RTX toxin-like protein
MAGNDTIGGGSGRDRLVGGFGTDTLSGDVGRDLLSGGRDDDVEHGGLGNDRIFANQGVDEEFGGPGADQLWALARVDVDTSSGPDTTGDTLHGGAGPDTFRTRDGEADKIDCGDGHDRALLDQQDVIVDAADGNPNGSCEVVTRADPAPRDNTTENAQQSPADNDQN